MSRPHLTLAAVYEFARALSRAASDALPSKDDWNALDEHFGVEQTWDADGQRLDVATEFGLGWTEGRAERATGARR